MTEKELHRLKRSDLLSLLLAQGQEAGKLQSDLQQTTQAHNLATEQNDRLKARLDEKDAQIERLKEKLNEKDAQLERLKKRLDEKDARIVNQAAQIAEYTSGRFLNMETVSSLTEISRRVDMVLQAAQKASQRFLRNAQERAQQQLQQAAQLNQANRPATAQPDRPAPAAPRSGVQPTDPADPAATGSAAPAAQPATEPRPAALAQSVDVE